MMVMRRHASLETTAASRALDGVRAAALSPVSIAALSAACVAIRLLRHHAGIGPHYSFVGTNLLLAWIPLLLAYGVSWSARSRSRWAPLPPFAVLWILFLPNAPYLVTDLVHLKDGVNAVNVVLLSLLALIGVLIGVKCVQLVQRAVEQLFGVGVGRRAVQVIAVLTAVGVYLGRVLRWNSWTVLHDPGSSRTRSCGRRPSRLGWGSPCWRRCSSPRLPRCLPRARGTAGGASRTRGTQRDDTLNTVSETAGSGNPGPMASVAPPQWRVPLADVVVTAADIAAVAAVYRSGWLSQGPLAKEFEEAFADYTGAPCAVAVTNCTAALHLMAMAAGLAPGDEVIMPSLTFVATANAVAYTGATPVFADIVGLAEPWMDPDSVRARITPRTKAIMSMPYGGHPGETLALAALADASTASCCSRTPPTHSARASGSGTSARSAGPVRTASSRTRTSRSARAAWSSAAMTTWRARLRLLRSHGMTRSRGIGIAGTPPATTSSRRVTTSASTRRAARSGSAASAGSTHENGGAPRSTVATASCLRDVPGVEAALAPAAGRTLAHHLFTVVLAAGATATRSRAGARRPGRADERALPAGPSLPDLCRRRRAPAGHRRLRGAHDHAADVRAHDGGADRASSSRRSREPSHERARRAGQPARVILAGGKGTRLGPFTTILPKPLLPVGDRAIVEIIIEQLRQSRIHAPDARGRLPLAPDRGRVRRRRAYGVELDYHLEHSPLGTAGALAGHRRPRRAVPDDERRPHHDARLRRADASARAQRQRPDGRDPGAYRHDRLRRPRARRAATARRGPWWGIGRSRTATTSSRWASMCSSRRCSA